MSIFTYFKELVNIPSPSGKEEKIREYLTQEFSSFGYKYREDDYKNIIFFKNENGKKTIFSCHMDTVELATKVNLKEDEEYFFTDKTTALGADDKAGIAVLLEVAKTVESDSLAFLFFVSEETGLTGSRNMDKKKLFGSIIPDSIFVIDASGEVGTIVTKAVGKTRLTLIFHGKSAHAGQAPEKGINAIVMASNFISSIKTGRLEEQTTSNIGSFIAPGSTNVVPENATVTMEIRSEDDETRYSLVTQYKKEAIEKAKEIGGRVEFKEEDLYKAYLIDLDSQIIKKTKAAFDKINLPLKMKTNTGGSDANTLISLGVPSLVLCTGYEGAHSVNEKMKKSELELLFKVVEGLSNV